MKAMILGVKMSQTNKATFTVMCNTSIMLILKINLFVVSINHHHHHRPVDVPTAGSQAFFIDYT
jgi:hypothetical protein